MKNASQKASFLELVWKRKSVRRYLPDPVEREQIYTCIEAARLAPSAENVQPWRFVILDDPVIKNNFAKEVFSGIYSVSKFATKAPVLIVILARPDFVANRLGKQIQGVQYYLIDIGIAGEHIILQAEELGLGTCWIGWFHVRKARKFLKIPSKYKIVSLISMGYYNRKPSRERKRKEMKEILFFNSL
ncbi:MAG: nitroreductase family protein [Candidatus Aminicenantes bacterium]|nr:nitroreductase family protein [Candidatus Aminicenantes bacterium]